MIILQPNYEKSVGKGNHSERVLLAGTLQGAPYGCGTPAARVPAGLPTLSP